MFPSQFFGILYICYQKNFEPIIQVLDLMNELFSSKVPSTRPWRPGWGAGDLTLTSCELSHKLIGVDAQEPLAGFKPKAFFHTCGEHSPHPVFPGA
jgi:hypothetical protein